jgi:3-oxoacyl-[acyl-carrier protein] reductase
MDLGLSGCRALVTGASKGLGKACAKALTDEGARVFICARDPEGIERAAKEVGAAGWASADVSSDTAVSQLVRDAVAQLGGLDILITNAGGPPTGFFENATDADWDIGYQLTLMSAVRLIRASLPALKASGRGRIINLTGFGVKEPPSDLSVSDSVRAAVSVMAKTVANDMAPFGITVNNVAPGPIRTDRLVELFTHRAAAAGITLEEQFSRFAATVPVRRVGEPEEVAGLCTYLCSLQAAYITGQSIVIDGGINRSI